MPAPTIHSTQYQRFRTEMKAGWQAANTPCAGCGQATIDWDGPANEADSFELDHKKPRITHPELTLDPGNCVPMHHKCNRHKSSGREIAGIGTTSEAW